MHGQPTIGPLNHGQKDVPAACRGNVLTEFALVVPLFLWLVFAMCDCGRLFFVETTLQNAVRQAGRYAVTGSHQPDPKHAGQQLSRIDSIIAAAQAAAIGIDISTIQISSVVGGRGSAGGPGDTILISLTSNVRLVTPLVSSFFNNGIYTFTVSVRMKNEPFPPENAI